MYLPTSQESDTRGPGGSRVIQAPSLAPFPASNNRRSLSIRVQISILLEGRLPGNIQRVWLQGNHCSYFDVEPV